MLFQLSLSRHFVRLLLGNEQALGCPSAKMQGRGFLNTIENMHGCSCVVVPQISELGVLSELIPRALAAPAYKRKRKVEGSLARRRRVTRMTER